MKLNREKIGVTFVFMLLAGSAILPASIATVIWEIIHDYEFYFSKRDTEIIENKVGDILILFYSLSAGIAFQASWKKYNLILKAAQLKKKTLFFTLMKSKMALAAHLWIGSTALALLGLYMLAYYPTAWTGRFVIFSITYIFVLCWGIALFFHNPMPDKWNFPDLPPEWLEELKNNKTQN